MALVRQHCQEKQLAASDRDSLFEGDRAAFVNLRLRDHPLRRSPPRIDLLLARFENGLTALFLGFDLGHFHEPLRPKGDVLHR